MTSELFDNVPARPLTPKAKKLSRKRAAVIEFLTRNTVITIPEAVSLIGGNVYANRAFHCGNILRAMCKAGIIERVSHGVYSLPGMPTPTELQKPTK